MENCFNLDEIASLETYEEKIVKVLIWKPKEIKRYLFGLFEKETEEGLYHIEIPNIMITYCGKEVDHTYLVKEDNTVWKKAIVVIYLKGGKEVTKYFESNEKAKEYYDLIREKAKLFY